MGHLLSQILGLVFLPITLLGSWVVVHPQEEKVERRTPEKDPRLFDVEYAVPAEAVQGKTKVTVRFQATGGNETAAVCGIRMIRADAER